MRLDGGLEKVIAVAISRFCSERDRRNAMNFPCAKFNVRTALRANYLPNEKEGEVSNSAYTFHIGTR